MSALDQETASRLIDVLTNPAAANKYESLKTRLTATFSLGRRERASSFAHARFGRLQTLTTHG